MIFNNIGPTFLLSDPVNEIIELTIDELKTIIIEDRQKHEVKINENSLQLEIAIALTLNKYSVPLKISELDRYLINDGYYDLNPSRWSISNQLKRLIRAGLVARTDDYKKGTYKLIQKIIDNSFTIHIYLTEDLKLVKNLLSEVSRTRTLFHKTNEQDLRILLTLKYYKVRDVLSNIQKHLDMSDIPRVLSKINNLLYLYNNSNSIKNYKPREHEAYHQFERKMKELLPKMRDKINELGGW